MTVTAHITTAKGLAAFEKLAADAREELFLSLRTLDPNTPLRGPELRERGLQTWADLLAHVARRGVRLRMIMADPDPLLTGAAHRRAWLQASGFADAVLGDVQILCAPHGHRLGGLWRAALRSKITAKMRALRAEEPARLTPVQRALVQTGPVLRPAVIDQSCAVADSNNCLIGVPEGASDDAHDVGVTLTGDFAAVLRAHLAETWNTALQAGAASLAERALPIDASVRPQATTDLRLVRTVSEPASGLRAFGPRPRLTEHAATLLKAIDAAERHIFIETPTLRHLPIAEALAAAAARAPALQLLLVLPTEPQSLTGGDALDAQYGFLLQHQALEVLRVAFGDRLALVVPAEGIDMSSTVTLIDDRFGMVGSADLSGRAMLWNTEASVAFREPALIAELRARLSNFWLGGKVEGDMTQAATWITAALDKSASQVRTYSAPGIGRRQRLLPDALF